MKKILLFSIFICAVSVKAQTIQEARALTDNEQFNEAGSMLFSLIAKEPSNAVNYYYLADKLILQDRVDSARKMLEIGSRLDTANPYIKIGVAKELLNRTNLNEVRAAMEKDPNNVDLRHLLDVANENVSRAKSLLEQAIAVAPPKTTQILLEAAEAMIKYENKDLLRAQALLEKVAKMDQKSVEERLLFGDLYTELNNGSLAAQYYNDALALNPQQPRAIVSKGKLYYRALSYEEAKTEFMDVITRFPNYVPAHRELGDTYFHLGKLDLAKAEYKTYLDMSSGGCYARNRYASFLYLTKDFQEAVNQCNQVLGMCDPTNPMPLRIMTISCYELKDYAQALEQINKVFNMLKPDHRISKDYEYYGKILIATNQDSLGIEQLKIAVALDSRRGDLLSEIAVSYLKLKKYPEVISFLKQKIALGRDVKSADYFNLGRSLYYTGAYTSSDSAFAKVNEVSPKYASAYLWRAKANTQLDTTSENGLAKPHYEKYIELAEADVANAAKYTSGLAEAYGYMAYYFVIKEDKSAALEVLKKKSALPLDPDEAKKVKDAISQLEGKK